MKVMLVLVTITVNVAVVHADVANAPDQRIVFEAQKVGTRSESRSFLVPNDTAMPVDFRVSLTGADFQLGENQCAKAVATSSQCSVEVRFAPLIASDRLTGQVKVEPSGAVKDSPKALVVELVGSSVLADLTISSGSILFPAQVIGTQSVPQLVTLSNATDTALSIRQIIIAGAFSAAAMTLPQSIEPHRSLVFGVIFHPQERGSLTGSVEILSDAPNSPHRILLSGHGVVASLPGCSWRSMGVALLLGACYWLATTVVRWNRIARPTRSLLTGQIESLITELDLLGGDVSRTKLLKDLLGKASEPLGNSSLLDRLLWSRGQELTGWGYVHEVEIRMATFRDRDAVVARLERVEQRLRSVDDSGVLALANSIHQALTANPPARDRRLQELLATALDVYYDRIDTSFADLLSWQNKTSWLVVCGLALIVALSAAFAPQAILFLVGAAGGLISRLSRSLDRKDVPTDYGASWTTLFLSPVGGALGAWAGVLICGLAVKLNVLGTAFVANWDDPMSMMTLGIGLLFGFSERLLDGVLDKVGEKSGALTAATNAKPAQKVPDSTVQGSDTPKATITPDTLPDGVAGSLYHARLTLTPAPAAPPRWSLNQGTWPDGLVLAESGAINGTPTANAVGTSTVTVQALTDGTQPLTRAYQLTIKRVAGDGA